MSHPKSSKVFVTGGTGFVGSYIIRNLVQQGYKVIALRRSNRVPFFITPDVWQQVAWVDGDVLDVVALADGMQGADAVVHSAAIVSFQPSLRRHMYKVNVEGTANVVNAAIEAGVPRVLHVSSIAALGRTTTGDTVNEEKKWSESKANTHYARTKHLAEVEAWRGFAEGLSGAIINPSTVLGFGNWHQSSLTIFKNVYRGFPWYTNGINGFVGVEDVAEIAVRLLFSDINHQRFILNSENLRFGDLFNMIAAEFGNKPPHRFASKTIGSVAWRVEKVKSWFTGRLPAVTRETAMLAHTKTYFDNAKLLQTLPGFEFQPIAAVVAKACKDYKSALDNGILTP